MQILRFPLGELRANCYFLIKDNECLLIDPADNADFILEEIQRRNLKLTGMLATHGHFDHVMAAGEIQLSHDIPLSVHEKDKFLLDRLQETANHFLEIKPVILLPKKINFFSKTSLQISNFKFQIIFTPGHTPGGVCFYLEKEKIIFTGDTLFKGTVGRTDLSYSNKDDLQNSLKKLLSLPAETMIYPGHGKCTTIDEECRVWESNP